MPPSDLNGAVEETMDAQYSVATAAATLASGRSDGAEVLFVALGSADAALRQQAWINLVRVALPVARATGATVQDMLAEAVPPTDGHRIEDWWRSSVDDRVIQHAWVRRGDFTKLYAQRRALFHMRSNIAGIIQTDLYLTGPPFPGPR